MQINLNVKSFHKFHIAELFGPRIFGFSVGQKKVLSANFGDFVADLKKNFNICRNLDNFFLVNIFEISPSTYCN